MCQRSIWFSVTRNRMSLLSSSFYSRSWMSWSLVPPVRPHRTPFWICFISGKDMLWKQSGDSIPIHQGWCICLHRKAVANPVGEQPNLLQYVSCRRIRPCPQSASAVWPRIFRSRIFGRVFRWSSPNWRWSKITCAGRSATWKSEEGSRMAAQ
jgi:hypothetical protein